MNEVKDIMYEVKGDLWLRHRWSSVLTKGGYLIVDTPFDLRETFEVEVMLHMVLVDASEKFDVHFDYEFHEDKIKVFALV